MIARTPPSRSRRTTARRIPLAPVLVAAAAFAGCGTGNADDAASGPPETPVNVRVLAVVARDLDEYVAVTGPLRPVRGTTVSTEESGTVASIARDKGARVAAGEALLTLDRGLLEADMRSAAAGVDLLEYDESRTRRLFEEKQVSRREMLSLETELARARAAADAARIRWSRAVVKAPFAGIVADRFVEPGELVAPGTPVARVVDPYTLELEGSVSEREVAWIRPGAAAAITLEGTAGAVPGRVAWVSLEAAPATGKFQVEVHVDNPDLLIRPGVVGRAEILERTHRDALVVPRDAIVPQPEGDAIYVVESERARLRPVELGASQGVFVQVVRGLTAGDSVIVRGQREVLDGSFVRVTETATAPDGTTDADPAIVRAEAAFSPVRTGTGSDGR